MKYYLTKLVVSLGLIASALGQNPVVREAAPGTSLPATCAVGERFFKTNATAGQNIYGCTSTNTWTVESGLGSPAGYTTVTYSATPTFTASSTTGTSFLITLTGNVTSSTLAAASTGQIITMNICQDGTGSRTFVFPTTMLNAGTIDATALACTHQVFIFDGTNAQALAPAYVTGPVGGKITMPGATSGSTVLQPAAISGSSVVTLPAATDTLMGKATTDIMTGKTFDTAGTGNVFRINGTGITAVNGSGAACLETGTSCLGASSLTQVGAIPVVTSAGVFAQDTGFLFNATGASTPTAGEKFLTMGSTNNAVHLWLTSSNTLRGSFGATSADGLNMTDQAGVIFFQQAYGTANVAFSGRVTALNVRATPVAVGSLPACAAGTEGLRATVNDSNAASYTAGIGAVVAAGGATHVPVFCDGTNWRIG